jgi:hypothetical protein
MNWIKDLLGINRMHSHLGRLEKRVASTTLENNPVSGSRPSGHIPSINS